MPNAPLPDLLIAGAGIVGTACALAAAEAGLRVVVVEPGAIGAGATAAGMGHLVALEDDPAEFALSALSLRMWNRHADLPEAEFSRCGTLWIAADEAELAAVAPKREAYLARGIAAELIDAPTLARLEPNLRGGLAGALRVPDDAIVYAPRVARVLLDRARALGARVVQGRRVVAMDAGGVRLDDGSRLAAARTLLACGVDTRTLVPELPLRPRKGHLLITERAPGFVRHQLIELGYLASAHGNSDSSVAFNVQPRPTGQVLIGSSRQYGVEDAAVEPAMLRRMLARARTYLPTIGELTALRAWTGFRPATTDGLPLIGPWPPVPGLWLATGHEGLGITTALATARLVVDAMTGATAPIDPTPYWPARVLSPVGDEGRDPRAAPIPAPERGHTTDAIAVRETRTPITPPSPASLVIHLDGVPVPCTPGTTLAAAIATGTRRSRTGTMRAPTCGMGVCGECRATVDGIAHVLTCQVRVAPGMRVTSEREPAHA